MSVCSMCKKEYERLNADALRNGAPICPECAARFETVLSSNDPGEVKSAVNYIYSCSVQAGDEGVRACLDEFLENNASAAEMLEADPAGRASGPVDVKKNDYYRDRSGWLLGASEPGVCKVLFIAGAVIILLGLIFAIVLASDIDYYPFRAFVSVFGTAVFAGLVLIGLAYAVSFLAAVAHNTSGKGDEDR